MFERAPPPAAQFPEGRVGYAVGDVHGRLDLLQMLMTRLEERAAQDERAAGPPIVIFLGDYVDRGPSSAAVVDLLLTGRPHGCEVRHLRGNHEQLMLAFIDNPIANRGWVLQGGAETLLSYGVQPPGLIDRDEAVWLAAAAELSAKIPQSHHDFFARLERYVALGDYAFVHAGVDPARALEDQTDEDLYWARERFIASKRRFSHRVVHGHTPVDRPYADARRIAVDTGAYASGTLTAARFEGDAVDFIPVSIRGPPVN